MVKWILTHVIKGKSLLDMYHPRCPGDSPPYPNALLTSKYDLKVGLSNIGVDVFDSIRMSGLEGLKDLRKLYLTRNKISRLYAAIYIAQFDRKERGIIFGIQNCPND